MRKCPDASAAVGRLASHFMNSSLPIIAGIISTIVFAVSTLPMLRKAAATKNLRSYSLGNIALANVGNLVHSIYVFSLPTGPIWVLHSFYLISSGLMLYWYLRYTDLRLPGSARSGPVRMRALPDPRSRPSLLV